MLSPSMSALKLIYSTYKLARNDQIFFFITCELISSSFQLNKI